MLGSLCIQPLQKSAFRLLLEDGADRDEDWGGLGRVLFGRFSQTDQGVT